MLPPESLDELLDRARAIAGRTLGDLAREQGIDLADDGVRTKGKFGQLVERALGGAGSSKSEHDFPAIATELKTIPLGPRGPIDDDPVSAMDAPAKRKLPADAEPAKQAGKTSAAKSPDDPPSKPRASGTSVEKPKAESPAPEAEQTAATGSNPARKKPSAEARSKAQSPDESEDNGKPKRRWDQNGASGSGYPTVVGPDGKEAPN